jgi:hypothetical protein
MVKADGVLVQQAAESAVTTIYATLRLVLSTLDGVERWFCDEISILDIAPTPPAGAEQGSIAEVALVTNRRSTRTCGVGAA